MLITSFQGAEVKANNISNVLEIFWEYVHFYCSESDGFRHYSLSLW
jgi:hypothetical protein